MTSDTLSSTARQKNDTRDNRRQAPAPTRHTMSWGWFIAPLFGAAGSGGLEYESIRERRRDGA